MDEKISTTIRFAILFVDNFNLNNALSICFILKKNQNSFVPETNNKFIGIDNMIKNDYAKVFQNAD